LFDTKINFIDNFALYLLTSPTPCWLVTPIFLSILIQSTEQRWALCS